ncbi:MAG: hypothetical protein R1F54_04300 [Candidatus Zeuxoniibacter abyssi]|nr:MAG: hypothetical protein R1F54_04300 [Candidatus Persebacteraceae bacterium AB1(2)]
MEDGEGLDALAEKIERLCARCDALARENARQKGKRAFERTG